MAGNAPTEGTPIASRGEVLGHVTSSFASPALGQAVMLGWLKRAPFPDQVEVDGRTAAVTAAPAWGDALGALEEELAARSDYLAALADRGICDPAAVANALTRYPSLPEGAPA